MAVVLAIAVGLAAHALQSSMSNFALPTVPPPAPTAANSPTAISATAVAAKVDPGVVDISTNLGFQNARAAGTGMVLTPTGLVLTNNHVITGATKISVTQVSNGHTYGATVIGYDRTDDIALLQMTGASGLQTVTLGNSAEAKPGEAVVALGNAGGVGGTPSAVTGRVSDLNQSITVTDPVDHSTTQLSGLIHAAIGLQPGDSGGPLADAAGHVLGIDTAASTGQNGTGGGSDGYAIPIDRAMAIAGQINAGHASSTVHVGATAMLGLETVAPRNGQSQPGATVAGVVPGSPADRAGLAPGDVIMSVDGHSVTSATTLGTQIFQHKPGDTVRVTWTDPAGQTHTAAAQLASGPPD